MKEWLLCPSTRPLRTNGQGAEYTVSVMNGYGVPFADQSRVFLDQAWIELEADDLQQASEKGWGAAAQVVKAAAEERGLPHDRHGFLFNVVSVLSKEADDQSLAVLFSAASGLHVNYYEGGLHKEAVGATLEQISQFVDRVGALLNGANGASGQPPSS